MYVTEMAERLDTLSTVKLGGFRSQLELTGHTDELWYNETICLWMTIYIYMCVCVDKRKNE